MSDLYEMLKKLKEKYGTQDLGEIAAAMNGRQGEYKKDIEVQLVIQNESRKYIDKPPSEWGNLTINWDLSYDNAHFCLDGVDACEFKEKYPEGISIGYVDLNKLDNQLCNFSRRDFKCGELWNVGCKDKLAKAIYHVSKGYPMTPPMIALPLFPDTSPDKSKFAFAGGNHRYTLAKAIGEIEIPIIISRNIKEKVNSIITVRWLDQNSM